MTILYSPIEKETKIHPDDPVKTSGSGFLATLIEDGADADGNAHSIMQ